MDGLKYYYMIEFQHDAEQTFPNISLKDFPGMASISAGSIEYYTYKQCSLHALDYLKSKLAVLNASEEKYKLYFEKNQFDESNLTNLWEEHEIIKIYISDSQQTVYNALFTARVFFTPSNNASDFYFEAPTTIQ